MIKKGFRILILLVNTRAVLLCGVLYKRIPVLMSMKMVTSVFSENSQKRINDFHGLFNLVLENLEKGPSPPEFGAFRSDVLSISKCLGKVFCCAGLCGIQMGNVVWIRKHAGKRINTCSEQELHRSVEGESRDHVLEADK